MRKIIVLSLFFAVLFSSCQDSKEEISESRIALDTVCSIHLYDEKDRHVVEPFFSLLYELQNTLDRYSENSELYYVNQNAYREEVALSPVLFDALKRALDLSRETGGAFNVAIGPLVDLWQIGKSDKLPSSEEIEKKRLLSDYSKIVLDEEKRTVRFLEEGMSLDLGGIGKGFIASKLMDFLKENGVERASINLGGNISLLGESPRGGDWRIGIRNPDGSSSEYVDVVSVPPGYSVSTSGSYERFSILEDGKMYSHILSSRTGYPIEGPLRSVTVISSDATLADALSTTAYVEGLDDLDSLSRHFDVNLIVLLEENELISLPSAQ